MYFEPNVFSPRLISIFMCLTWLLDCLWTSHTKERMHGLGTFIPPLSIKINSVCLFLREHLTSTGYVNSILIFHRAHYLFKIVKFQIYLPPFRVAFVWCLKVFVEMPLVLKSRVFQIRKKRARDHLFEAVKVKKNVIADTIYWISKKKKTGLNV